MGVRTYLRDWDSPLDARGNRLVGIGLSALTATNSQQVFRSVAVHSTTGRFNCKRYAEQVGARQKENFSGSDNPCLQLTAQSVAGYHSRAGGGKANYKQVNLTNNCKVLRGFERLSVSEKQVKGARE